MKSLMKVSLVFVLLTLFAACGGSNKSGSSSSSAYSSGSYTSVSGDVSYQTIRYKYSNIRNGDRLFYRYYDKSSGIYREDDGYTSESQVDDLLDAIRDEAQYSQQGCNIGPADLQYYYHLYRRQYEPGQCYMYMGSRASDGRTTIYYIDYNYPIEANPVAKIRTTYEEDSWWIFDTYTTKNTGYYMSDIGLNGGSDLW